MQSSALTLFDRPSPLTSKKSHDTVAQNDDNAEKCLISLHQNHYHLAISLASGAARNSANPIFLLRPSRFWRAAYIEHVAKGIPIMKKTVVGQVAVGMLALGFGAIAGCSSLPDEHPTLSGTSSSSSSAATSGAGGTSSTGAAGRS